MALINLKKIFTTAFDDDALATAIQGDHVLNFGELKTSGDLANDISVYAHHVSIFNFAHIETTGLGAAGIFVQGDDAHVENYGSVATSGGVFDPDPNVDGDEFFSDAITVFGDRFYIANYGSVKNGGDFSSGLSGIGDNGIVINFGHVDSGAFASAVVAVVGDGSRVINAGEVTVHGDESDGLLALGIGAEAINLGRIVVDGEASDAMSANGLDRALTNKGVIEVKSDFGAAMSSFGIGDQLNNSGVIKTSGSFDVGMAATGGHDFKIVNTGHVTTDGDLAFGLTVGVTPSFGFDLALSSTVDNRGVIETKGDGAAGVALAGDNDHFTNSGRITTNGGSSDEDPFIGVFHAAGVVVSGNEASLENTRSGVIESKNVGSAAVELNIIERDGLTVADTATRLENSGLIKGVAIAIGGGEGQETVINHGQIIGDVVLGDGADTFVFGKGGSLTGNLYLGGGHNLVEVENGSGISHLADFQTGDLVDVSVFFSNFNNLKAHSVQHGNDVIVSLDHNDQLVLGNTQLMNLHAGDFLFV
jgi:hypothetical protein